VTGSDSKRDAVTAAGAAGLVATADESLLDVIDNLLNRGVLLHGELVLGLADVDLVYARLSLLLCAADRVLPPSR
jgi:Gas vesicle protein